MSTKSTPNANPFAGFRIRLQAQRQRTGETFDGPLTGGIALFATIINEDDAGNIEQPDFPAMLPEPAVQALRERLGRDERDLPNGAFELISVKETGRGYVGNYRIPEDLSALFAGAQGSGMKAKPRD